MHCKYHRMSIQNQCDHFRSSKDSQAIDDLSDGKHTQTESRASNDAAVNTGKLLLSRLTLPITKHTHPPP